MRNGHALITAGVIGSAVAAVCCATPLLAVALGALGLTAWLSRADFVLIPALLVCLGLVGIGLYRRRATAQACRGPAAPGKVSSHD
jgi:mercuric ion transport protein